MRKKLQMCLHYFLDHPRNAGSPLYFSLNYFISLISMNMQIIQKDNLYKWHVIKGPRASNLYFCPVKKFRIWRNCDRIDFVDGPTISITALCVAMETMRFLTFQTCLYLSDNFFCIQGVPFNNLAWIKITLWMRGRSNYYLTFRLL